MELLKKLKAMSYKAKPVICFYIPKNISLTELIFDFLINLQKLLFF